MPAKKKATKSKSAKSQSKKVSTQPAILSSINFYYQPVIKNFKAHKKPWLISIVVVGLILAVVIPHLFVAFVDKKPISIISYYQMLDSKYGKDLKEQMISEQLVDDEARARGVSISDAQINSEISKYETQASGSANLTTLLSQQGLTMDSFKRQIKLQLEVQKMFGDKISVTDDEVSKYIDQNKAQLPDPITNQVKQQIKDQLKQQKTVTDFQTWLQAAQQSNRVIRL